MSKQSDTLPTKTFPPGTTFQRSFLGLFAGMISIIENAGLMGIPIPAVITKAIEVLKKKAESEE